MVKRSQQQTLSVRIGSALRQRLTRIQRGKASRVGYAVSLSEVAKSLLGAARGRDVEVAELLSDPTAVLLTARRKRAGGLPLTPAEWIVVAHFVQVGMESMQDGLGLVPARLVVGVLDAFSAVHLLRGGASEWDESYVGNLSTECWSLQRAGGRIVIADMAQHVRETVAKVRRQLVDGGTLGDSLRAGRNLHLLLAEDHVNGAEAINQALTPHWLTLWSLAARGHYAITGRPVRSVAGSAVSSDETPPLMLRDGAVALSCLCREELCVSVTFPGAVTVVYPLQEYPVVREFSSMVSALAGDAKSWQGAWFRGYVGAGGEGIWFHALANGIIVGCRRDDWGRLQGLLGQAWKTADVEQTWERLADEYGEL